MNRKNIKKTLATTAVLLTLGISATSANALQQYEYLAVNLYAPTDMKETYQKVGSGKIWVNAARTEKLNKLGAAGWEYAYSELVKDYNRTLTWFKRPLN